MVPFHGWGSIASRMQSHYEETVYFLPLSPNKFMILIWSTSERWKAELVPSSGFEQKYVPVYATHCGSCLRFR